MFDRGVEPGRSFEALREPSNSDSVFSDPAGGSGRAEGICM